MLELTVCALDFIALLDGLMHPWRLGSVDLTVPGLGSEFWLR